MANEAKKTPLEIAKEAYDLAMKQANEALGKNPVDLVAYNAAMGALDKAEKDYAKAKATDMYNEYAKKPNPIVEIIKAYSYETLAHKEKRSEDKDNPRVIAINPDTRKRQIDLLAFCSHAKLDTHWELTASHFNQLMCLRTAKELGADVDKIAKSYFLKEKAREIKLGKTPTSNSQVCKLLQTVIDEILPCNDDDTPIYKCNNYDVKYLDALYGKKSNKHDIHICAIAEACDDIDELYEDYVNDMQDIEFDVRMSVEEKYALLLALFIPFFSKENVKEKTPNKVTSTAATTNLKKENFSEEKAITDAMATLFPNIFNGNTIKGK